MKTFVKRIAAVLATATVALLVVGSATAGTAQAKPRDLDWYPVRHRRQADGVLRRPLLIFPRNGCRSSGDKCSVAVEGKSIFALAIPGFRVVDSCATVLRCPRMLTGKRVRNWKVQEDTGLVWWSIPVCRQRSRACSVRIHPCWRAYEQVGGHRKIRSRNPRRPWPLAACSPRPVSW